MSKTLECFDLYYEKLGWSIIAIRPRSKQPAMARWQKDGTYRAWQHRSFLAKSPDANIGLLLGRVVDVEADTYEANELLEAIIGDYPHMRYASHKSVHHLFINPFKNMTRVVVKGIEFRAKNHQSLLPPSTHPCGAKYRWLRPTTWDLTEMPDALRKLCLSRDAVRATAAALVKITCASCGQEYTIPASLAEAEVKVFRLVGEKWMCRAHRKIDLRQARRLVRRGRTEEATAALT